MQPLSKNKVEDLRIGIGKYKGHALVSLRVWVDQYQSTEKAPTKKGISVRVQLLPKLIAALQEAEKEARAAGMFGIQERDQAA